MNIVNDNSSEIKLERPAPITPYLFIKYRLLNIEHKAVRIVFLASKLYPPSEITNRAETIPKDEKVVATIRIKVMLYAPM